MNKLISGIVAVGIYFGLVFIILLYYNVHEEKAKNYVEKNSNRVTVTLVNSDKTVFNKSSKVTTPTKGVDPSQSIKQQIIPPIIPIPIPIPVPKKQAVKTVPKVKAEPKKLVQPKEDRRKKEKEARVKAEQKKRELARIKVKEENRRAERVARLKKEKEIKRLATVKANKEAKRQERIKKDKEVKRLATIKANKEAKRQERIKKDKEVKRLATIKANKEAKRQERIKKDKEVKRLATIKANKEAKRQERIKAERERKKLVEAEAKKNQQRSKDLFASVTTSSRPKPVKEPSQVRHNSSVTDRIKNTHLSGQISNRNRERGVENAYIAKVQSLLHNWPAESNYKGSQVKIKFTIYSSGKFKFRLTSRSPNQNFNQGLIEYLKQLQRIGFGQHSKSTPYDIAVTFRAR